MKRTLQGTRLGSSEPHADNSDDVAPLLTVIGAISAVFWAGMIADKIGPLLRTQAVVEIAVAHAATLILVPAVAALALTVVAFLRLIVGPFDLQLQTFGVELRSGSAAFIAWLFCVVLEIGIVKLFW